jgi:CheY-like chemotaxis protein
MIASVFIRKYFISDYPIFVTKGVNLVSKFGKSVVMKGIILMLSATRKNLSVLLAEDDEDDRLFFREAVTQVNPDIRLKMVEDGDKLLSYLNAPDCELPDILFLDLNMPKKNGFECLADIKKDPRLKGLPVVIFSTAGNQDGIDRTFASGASFYVQKPNSIAKLKKLAARLFAMDWEKPEPTKRDEFVIN